ncbi:MAG: urease accessory protein UreE [Opitutales bacterium]|nr:urease accessory protein UreE [Opitutales bacterium]MBT5813171.1 urease accessory protein UreE [Opitutales bacterium]MDG2256614.1 urease accessory protein UreE [Opitutaceae bacterium]
MNLITNHLSGEAVEKETISLKVDRRKLAKRRWRGIADDGEEFGFDLQHPLTNGTPFHETEKARYQIEQTAENVLRIPFADQKQAAYYGWMVGNLHFSADFEDTAVIAEEDPAVRQMLERNHIQYQEATSVFEPVIVSHGHSH